MTSGFNWEWRPCQQALSLLTTIKWQQQLSWIFVVAGQSPIPFNEVHSHVGESLRDSQIAKIWLRSPFWRDGAACFIERYRGKVPSVCLAQPDRLANKGTIVAEGQRPRRWRMTRYLGCGLAHQTAGLWTLSAIRKPATQPFLLGYVNCWAFGPNSLVRVFVGDDTTERPKTHSAIRAKRLKAMIF